MAYIASNTCPCSCLVTISQSLISNDCICCISIEVWFLIIYSHILSSHRYFWFQESRDVVGIFRNWLPESRFVLRLLLLLRHFLIIARCSNNLQIHKFIKWCIILNPIKQTLESQSLSFLHFKQLLYYTYQIKSIFSITLTYKQLDLLVIYTTIPITVDII